MKEDVPYEGFDLVESWKKRIVAFEWLLAVWIRRLFSGSYVGTPECFAQNL